MAETAGAHLLEGEPEEKRKWYKCNDCDVEWKDTDKHCWSCGKEATKSIQLYLSPMNSLLP